MIQPIPGEHYPHCFSRPVVEGGWLVQVCDCGAKLYTNKAYYDNMMAKIAKEENHGRNKADRTRKTP